MSTPSKPFVRILFCVLDAPRSLLGGSDERGLVGCGPTAPLGRGRRARNLRASCTRHFCKPIPAPSVLCTGPRPTFFHWKTANPLQPARSSLHIGIRETIPVPEGRPAPSNDSSGTHFKPTDARHHVTAAPPPWQSTSHTHREVSGFLVPGIENGEPVRNRDNRYYSLQRRYTCLRKHRHLFIFKTAGAAATLFPHGGGFSKHFLNVFGINLNNFGANLNNLEVT